MTFVTDDHGHDVCLNACFVDLTESELASELDLYREYIPAVGL